MRIENISIGQDFWCTLQLRLICLCATVSRKLIWYCRWYVHDKEAWTFAPQIDLRVIRSFLSCQVQGMEKLPESYSNFAEVLVIITFKTWFIHVQPFSSIPETSIIHVFFYKFDYWMIWSHPTSYRNHNQHRLKRHEVNLVIFHCPVR